MDVTLPEEGITAEEYDRLPEEICRRIEIVDGSIIVSPSATPRHNRIAWRLASRFEEAVPAPWQVTTNVDLRITDVPLLNRRPDVLVFEGDLDVLPVRPPQVLLVVEIMSKGSINADRIDKPAEYASVGIPHYWRIEHEGNGPICYTHMFNRTTHSYASSGAHSGILTTEHPFPVEIDLDGLL
jgi:Uma2 family endonuclease